MKIKPDPALYGASYFSNEIKKRTAMYRDYTVLLIIRKLYLFLRGSH
jgi:hypothetical protein